MNLAVMYSCARLIYSITKLSIACINLQYPHIKILPDSLVTSK